MEYIESRRNRAVRVAVSCFLICALVFSVIACGMISPTVYAADTTIGVGPDNGIATGEQLARVSDKLPVYVGDLYGNIWGTETEIELFKVEYENNEHKVTIAGRNNESVIAPGTENSYAFSVKNESERILDYRVFIILVSLFLIVFFIGRMVSLGSIIASLGMPISIFIVYHGQPYWWVLCIIVGIMALTLIWRHRSNIVRIFKGTENKFKLWKKTEDK